MTRLNLPESCANCMSSYLPKPVVYDGMTFCCPECFFAYLVKREGLSWSDDALDEIDRASDCIETGISNDFKKISEEIEDISEKLECHISSYFDESTIKSLKTVKNHKDYLAEIKDELQAINHEIEELSETVTTDYEDGISTAVDALEDIKTLLKF